MEIYELPITSEESRNYHQFLYRLRALKFRDWIMAYIMTILYILVLCAVVLFFSENVILMVWYKTGIMFKILIFITVFVVSALQRSKSIQLKAMFQKYFVDNMPKEFLEGHIQLKKIKIQGDRILIYYRKVKD